MYLFIIVICSLYIGSLFKKDFSVFSIDKILPVRGILALIIILHHISFILDNRIINIFHSWGAPCVSIFFFISGYGLMASLSKKGRAYLTCFIKHRIFHAILLPFLLALVLYRIINYGSVPNLYEGMCNLFKNGLTTLPHSWYVFAIIILYIFFYVGSKISDNKTILVLMLFVLSFLYIYITQMAGFERCWYISILAFPFGVLYASVESRIMIVWQRYKNIAVLLVPFCLFIIAIIYYFKIEQIYLIVYVLIPLIIAYLFSKLNIEKLNDIRFLSFLSKISYEIYLCQGIAMTFLRDKLIYIESDLIYIILSFLLTFILAYFVSKFKKFLLNYI